jgi:eukaryotic-like serine/threonine-protein kinase
VALAAGSRLGPYEIQSAIGAGGMGEVYKARDTRLDRVVALKVLPSHLASPDSRERFEREARMISGLNHPNICTLHDVGHQDGIDFLVMEYLEGETLAGRLTRGALPAEQVKRYGIEIAAALDAAHRKGIVHRDLKPVNIMLTRSGVKVLDFGLAKPNPSLLSGTMGAAAAPATQTTPLTAQGSVIGTLQYMAPEQLEGREADARTDIFAFGAVLYEMVTGRRAFEGKSPANIVAAILESHPPPIAAAQPLTPPALDRVVRTCLARDPDDRWQSARDLAHNLHWIADEKVIAKDPHRHVRYALAGSLLLLSLTILVVMLLNRQHTSSSGAERQPVVFEVRSPDGQNFFGPQPSPVVSPDGRRIAYAVTTAASRLIHIQRLDSIVAEPLAGTEGGAEPFWSPDGRALGFFAAGKLKTIKVAGGPAQVICDAVEPRGGSWGRDGTIMFAVGAGPLYRVNASGSMPAAIATADGASEEGGRRYPQFLPDGRRFLYYIWRGPEPKRGIYIGSLDSPVAKRLMPSESAAIYTEPGYLLFARADTLLAQRFDVEKLEPIGDPVPVASSISIFANERGEFAAAGNVLVTMGRGVSSMNRLVWKDRRGTNVGRVGPDMRYISVDLSPNARHVAVEVSEPSLGRGDIWIVDVARDSPTKLTSDAAGDFAPVWGPDSERLVFASNRQGPSDLYQTSVTGVQEDVELLISTNLKVAYDWSTDGRYVVYGTASESPAGITGDVWFMSLPERKQMPFLTTKSREVQAQISPDVKWMAYTSNQSGQYDVYAQTFPVPTKIHKISTDGGSYPRWRPDGKELFYVKGDQLMAVAVGGGSDVPFGRPAVLFDLGEVTGRPPAQGFRQFYDVTADGRFLFIEQIKSGVPSRMTVTLNWTETLRR